MNAYLPDYEVQSATKLNEALEILNEQPGVWTPLAGGTDLMVLFESGRLPAGKYLSIWNLEELRGIKEESDRVSLGALTSYSDILESPIFNREFPMLCDASRLTGAVAIQNRGTIGGNIVNASPAADTPPALLAYDTTIEVISTRGTRKIPYREFHRGYKKTDLREDELLYQVHIERPSQKLKQFYRKVGTRKAQAISKVCLAAILSKDTSSRVDQVRIAMGSVAPVPIACEKTEKFLLGKKVCDEVVVQAQRIFAQEISPIDDIRSNRAYRQKVSQNLLRLFLEES